MDTSGAPDEGRDWIRFVSDLHHRLKNNLQTLVSVINLQASRTTDPNVGRAIRTIQNRVRAIAGVFGNDSTPDLAMVHFGSYLTSLVRDLAAEYAISHRVEIQITAADMAVGIDKAIPLALIANELAANALEHAFGERERGKVSVTLSYEREPFGTADALGYAILDVIDDGVPLPGEWGSGAGEATGLYLVKTLTSQLRGQFNVQESSSGKRFRVRFPLEP
ncbi:MAG: sensor histidine kinase [Bryobacteraceae bacterium]